MLVCCCKISWFTAKCCMHVREEVLGKHTCDQLHRWIWTYNIATYGWKEQVKYEPGWAATARNATSVLSVNTKKRKTCFHKWKCTPGSWMIAYKKPSAQFLFWTDICFLSILKHSALLERKCCHLLGLEVLVHLKHFVTSQIFPIYVETGGWKTHRGK